jgi:hypothetical protein
MNTRAMVSLASLFLASAVLAGSARSDTPPNFSGTWTLDASRSDDLRKMMGSGPGGAGRGAGWHGERGQGTGGAPDRAPGGRRGGRAGRRGTGGPGGPRGDRPSHAVGRLPDRFTLVQTAGLLQMTDSTGTEVRRIVTTGDAAPAPGGSNEKAGEVAPLQGHWKGEDLEIELGGPNGGGLTQTMVLADGGNTLKVTTRVTPAGDRSPFEFTRVYARVAGS